MGCMHTVVPHSMRERFAVGRRQMGLRRVHGGSARGGSRRLIAVGYRTCYFVE